LVDRIFKTFVLEALEVWFLGDICWGWFFFFFSIYYTIVQENQLKQIKSNLQYLYSLIVLLLFLMSWNFLNLHAKKII
jgi:hypothetical protein